MATKKDVTTAATTIAKAEVKPAAKTAPVKTETKAAASTKTEAKTDTKKETVTKKATATKKAAKKTTTRATAKKTTAAKTTTAKAVKENAFVIEYNDINISQTEIMDKVKAALTEQGAKPAGLKNVDVYVQPENNVAYYVSNAGKASELKGSVALS